jgi:hypothetical protein
MRSELKTIASLAAMGILTLAAFNQQARKQIKERANYQCEVTGRKDLPMDCIHLDHTRGSKHYNDPANGFYGTVIVHLAHHTIYRDYPRAIGLTYAENEWSIQTLKKRCLEVYGDNEELFNQEYQEAEDKLKEYLSAKKEA